MKLTPRHIAVMLFLFAAGAGACKKSTPKKSAPVASKPTANVVAEEKCQAKLALVEPLPPINPEQLKLDSAKIEEYKIGSYKAAKLSFALNAASALPDTMIYRVCSTKDVSKCKLGATASPIEYDALLPTEQIKMEAWACVGPDRLAKGVSSKKFEVAGLGDYYCGAPVTAFGYQAANPRGEAFAKAQAEIVTLKNQAMKLAFELHGIVADYVKKGSQDRSLIAIANSPKEVFGEAALYLYQDAKTAVAYGAQVAGSGSQAGLNLASADSNCVPPVSDEDIQKAFNPPATTQNPSNAQGSGSVTAPSKDKTVEEDTLVSAPTPDPSIASQNDCKTRDEFLKSQDKGSATWDAATLRCFVSNTSSQQQDIDSSVTDDEEMPSVPTQNVASKNKKDEKKLNSNQQAGVFFAVLGGVIAAGGIAVVADGWLSKSIQTQNFSGASTTPWWDIKGKYNSIEAKSKMKYGGIAIIVGVAMATILGSMIEYGLTDSVNQNGLINNPVYLSKTSELYTLLGKIEEKITLSSSLLLSDE